MTWTLSSNDQLINLSYTADDTLNSVDEIKPGTPRSCSIPGAVATIGNRSIYYLSVISVKIFESQCITTKSSSNRSKVSENLDLIAVASFLCKMLRALLIEYRLRTQSFIIKDRVLIRLV